MGFTLIKNFRPRVTTFGLIVLCITWLINTFSVPSTNAVDALGRPGIWIVLVGIILFICLVAWNINQQKQINELLDKKASKANDDLAGIRK